MKDDDTSVATSVVSLVAVRLPAPLLFVLVHHVCQCSGCVFTGNDSGCGRQDDETGVTSSVVSLIDGRLPPSHLHRRTHMYSHWQCDHARAPVLLGRC